MASFAISPLLVLSAWAADPPSVQGDITITEFQADSSEVSQYYGEWFEVYNNSGATITLQGVTFTTSSGSFTVDTAILVGVEDYAVFGASDEYVDSSAADFNGGATVDYQYDFFNDINLAQSADSITATYGSVVLDELIWDSSWGVSRDYAHQASLNASSLEWANDASENWCASGSRYPLSNMYGTPKAENEYCNADPGNDTDADGYTETNGDCNDDDPDINPGEIDGTAHPYGDENDDANCDGVRDDGIQDNDGDGYTEVDGDCDDDDVSSYPGASEGRTADGLDNDCNGCVDDLDTDGDGYGLNPQVCGEDCDDEDSAVYPGANEIPYDGIDQDCDDEDQCDLDGDLYLAIECDCGARCSDCDDTNANVHPGAPEEEDGLDNDCDDIIDTPDRDGDGYTVDQGDCLDLAPENDPNDVSRGVNPEGVETCGDLLDNDCDGFYDNKPECTNAASYAVVRGGGMCGVGGGAGGPVATILAAALGLMAAARRRTGDTV